MGARVRSSRRRTPLAGAVLAVLLGCGGGGSERIPAVPSRVASDDPFDEAVLHYVDLTVAEADLPLLVPGSDAYVRCDLVFDETAVAQVGIRIKGQATLRPVGDKPSWSLKTNAFVSGQKLHGKKKILLHNCVLDASFLHEPVAYEVWRRAGHPARRTAHARVTLNGRYLGVYVVAEPYDDGFLAANFADGTGNLYEGVAEVDVTDPAGLELDTNEAANDRSDMEALAAVVLAEPDATFPAALEGPLDVEGFLTYWGVEALLHHWDGYAAQNPPAWDPTWGPNNWYAYGDPSDGDRISFLPHSADACFLDAWAPVRGPPAPASALAARSFADPGLRARYEARIAEILDTAWDVEALLARVEAAWTRIAGSVYEGDASATFRLRDFRPGVDHVRRFLRDRPGIVRGELAP